METKAELIELCHAAGMHGNDDGLYWPGTYVCSHGEYARPLYYPRRYADGYSLRAEYSYYSGTFYARQDGRVDPEFMDDLENRANYRRELD